MISDKLYPRWGERLRVEGTFTGCGRRGRSLLFENLVDCETGEVLRDHSWIQSSEFSFRMRVGDTVSFETRIYSYEQLIGDLKMLGLGFGSCTRFWCESRNNRVSLWNPKAKLEVAA